MSPGVRFIAPKPTFGCVPVCSHCHAPPMKVLNHYTEDDSAMGGAAVVQSSNFAARTVIQTGFDT